MQSNNQKLVFLPSLYVPREEPSFTFCQCSLCLNCFHLLVQKPNLEKNYIYSNKFFHNFFLFQALNKWVSARTVSVVVVNKVSFDWFYLCLYCRCCLVFYLLFFFPQRLLISTLVQYLKVTQLKVIMMEVAVDYTFVIFYNGVQFCHLNILCWVLDLQVNSLIFLWEVLATQFDCTNVSDCIEINTTEMLTSPTI